MTGLQPSVKLPASKSSGRSDSGGRRPPSAVRRPSSAAVRRLTHMEAVVEAMAEAMRRDERVFFIGQDVGPFGGSMQGAKGLYEEFGPGRVREAPISESAMVGAAIGAALFGRRPIVEV